MRQKILDYIIQHNLSSTAVADALGKTGSIENISAVNHGHFVVGNVRWIYCFGGSNYVLHKQLREVMEGEIIIVEGICCENKAMFGDIVAQYLFHHKKIKAVVALGKLRDAPSLIQENYAIWCEGFTPIGCHNYKIMQEIPKDILESKINQYRESIAVCDDTGVVVISNDFMNNSLYRQLELICAQEKIWNDCIQNRGMDTYETICLKKYCDKN